MRAIVVADGEPAGEDAGLLAGADLVIAADGGARWIEEQGCIPDLLVGDLDSLDADTVARLASRGTRVERHPTAKDASDTELALEAALREGADRVVLLGALRGPRLDHELANLLLLARPAFASTDLRAVHGATHARGLRGGQTLTIEAGVGETVSLFPVGGDATGVTTTGLRYPLDGETLAMGSTRGLSNQVSEEAASVGLEVGALLVLEQRGAETNGEGES